jgi:hypothetical protein
MKQPNPVSAHFCARHILKIVSLTSIYFLVFLVAAFQERRSLNFCKKLSVHPIHGLSIGNDEEEIVAYFNIISPYLPARAERNKI